MTNNRYILIMAGGVGSRFWPASRESRPKQFLDILQVGRSLIQLTYDRAIKLVPKENILIATNEKYKALTLEHLPDLENHQILCEPSRNNTAPCIAYAALKLNQKDPNSVFAVLPSDHVILKEDQYLKLMTTAFEIAENSPHLVTLGITPTRPDTGYGYIESAPLQSELTYLTSRIAEESISPKKVISFKEKPNLETAKKYLQKGNYLWNAGMFIWSTASILDAFSKYAKDITEILSEDISCFNTNNEQEYINKTYPKTPSISIDYAILESADNVITIPADISWSDLGTWNSLHDYLKKDQYGNVIQGNIDGFDLNNNLIKINENKKLVIKGISNFIIIDDDDVLLIYPKDEEQDIKKVREQVDQKYK